MVRPLLAAFELSCSAFEIVGEVTVFAESDVVESGSLPAFQNVGAFWWIDGGGFCCSI